MKKPRLFYYEDAVDAWVIVPCDISSIVDVDAMLEDGEIVSVEFKRIDMSDAELENLPES